MTVRELIEQLSKFDPETPVLGSCTDPTDYTYKVEIESIELGNPYDSGGYNGLDGSEMFENEDDFDDDDEDYDDEDDDDDDKDPWDDDYKGPKVVIINLGDV